MLELVNTWLDFALDRARDAGWHVRWGVREVAPKVNFGPRMMRKEHWIRLVDSRGVQVCQEHTGHSLDGAAFALTQTMWPSAEDLAEAA